jgi:hypothetical protein
MIILGQGVNNLLSLIIYFERAYRGCIDISEMQYPEISR